MSKRRAWLEEYFKCWNATEAARRVGYAWPEKSGPLNKSKLQAEIDARLDEMAISANEVLARLGEQARADLGDYITQGGLLDWEKLKTNGLSRLIKKYKVTQDAMGRIKYEIEVYDAQAALMHLDRYHGGEDGKAIDDRVTFRFVSNVDDDKL
jgi:phage terminase small subunit